MRILLAALMFSVSCFAGGGQGPVEDGPIQVEDIRLGKYWYGKEINLKHLKGKVVLLEIWGS
jgi:hypothetical protein